MNGNQTPSAAGTAEGAAALCAHRSPIHTSKTRKITAESNCGSSGSHERNARDSDFLLGEPQEARPWPRLLLCECGSKPPGLRASGRRAEPSSQGAGG